MNKTTLANIRHWKPPERLVSIQCTRCNVIYNGIRPYRWQEYLSGLDRQNWGCFTPGCRSISFVEHNLIG